MTRPTELRGRFVAALAKVTSEEVATSAEAALWQAATRERLLSASSEGAEPPYERRVRTLLCALEEEPGLLPADPVAAAAAAVNATRKKGVQQRAPPRPALAVDIRIEGIFCPPPCRSNDVLFKFASARSADEGQVAFVRCRTCHRQWRM